MEFDWDIDLLSGYRYRFLDNRARRPSPSRFWGSDCPELRNLLTPEHFDAVLLMGWHIRAYWQAITVCRRRGLPILVRGESQLPMAKSRIKTLAKKFIHPRILSNFSAGCYIGLRNREFLVNHGMHQSCLFFSPYCVDNEFFRHKYCKENVEPDKSPSTIMFCGKLIHKKRPVDFLEGTRKALTKGTQIRAVVVGSGPLEQHMRDYAVRHGLPVSFVGFQNQRQLPRWYVAADVLVLPSDGTETWGLVVNEAMACGTPAIVSDAVGCGPDLIEPGLTGEVFPLGDTDALASAICRMLGRKRLPEVQEALRRKMEVYSIETAAKGILEAAEFAVRSRQRRN